MLQKMHEVAVFDIQTLKWEYEDHTELGLNLGYKETRRLCRDGQPNEVVSISFRVLNFLVDDFQSYTPAQTLYIKTTHSEMSDKTLQKLGISREEYEDKCVHLSESARWLKSAFADSNRQNAYFTCLPVWASWGHYPFERLNRDYSRIKAKNPFSARVVNLKTLAGFRINKGYDAHLKETLEQVYRLALGQYSEVWPREGRSHLNDLDSISDVAWWLLNE